MINKVKTVLDDLKIQAGKLPLQPRNNKVEDILISPIKTQQDTNEPHNQWATYYQAFFQLEGIKSEISVIFRVRCPGGNQVKPKIPLRSKVELTGQWAESPSSGRLSFTCSYYRILTEPPQPTIKDLREQISSLLTTSLEKKKEWTERTDYLFKKQKDLSEIDKLSKLGAEYLRAYLLLRKAFYSNYQDNLLPDTVDLTNQEAYLTKLTSEIEDIACQVLAYQSKE